MLSIQHVTKRFGKHVANDDISLSIDAGRIFGLLGPNGAGKTTLIRMITNIILPDQGEIKLDGRSTAEVLQNEIGYLPEERGLYKKLTVAEQLMYFGQLKGLDRRTALERATWWLKRMDASGWETKKVQELSKGMLSSPPNSCRWTPDCKFNQHGSIQWEHTDAGARKRSLRFWKKQNATALRRHAVNMA